MRLLFGFILVSINCWAITEPGTMKFGDPIAPVGARSLGMGGTIIENDPSCIFFNPGILSYFKKPLLSVSSDVIALSEEAIFPYGSEIIDKSYNSQTFIRPAFIGAVIPVKRFAIGVGFFPLNDFGYKNEVTVYDDSLFPVKRTGVNRIESSGRIYSYSAILGFRFTNQFSLGCGGYLLNGKRNFGYKKIYYDTTKLATEINDKSKFSGNGLNIGTLFRLRNTNFSFSYKIMQSIIDDWSSLDSSGSNEYKNLQTYIFGISHKFNNSTIAFSITKKDYSKLKLNGIKNPENYVDIVELHIGAEWWLKPDIPLRYGFYIEPWYGDKKVERVFLTAGFGMKAMSTRIDLSGGLGKREFIGDSFLYSNGEKINETISRLLLTILLGSS
jgi:hypothetical protein